jgi:hypothetical protein
MAPARLAGYFMQLPVCTPMETKAKGIVGHIISGLKNTIAWINNAEELDLGKLEAAYICLYLLVHRYTGAISNMDSFSTGP